MNRYVRPSRSCRSTIRLIRAAVEESGRTFDPFSASVTRAFQMAHTAAERERQHELRIRFLRNVRQLSDPPPGVAASGHFRPFADDDDMKKHTRTDALISTPEEIVRRLKDYEAAGVQHLLLMDVDGSRDSLRIFGREILPEFRT
jgi:alkanesulfonate monooxygenase SsuD/methylene tetrahydromethanopterin reductase-like flavin-dependent oxidoreductase (luciferase family)